MRRGGVHEVPRGRFQGRGRGRGEYTECQGPRRSTSLATLTGARHVSVQFLPNSPTSILNGTFYHVGESIETPICTRRMTHPDARGFSGIISKYTRLYAILGTLTDINECLNGEKNANYVLSRPTLALQAPLLSASLLVLVRRHWFRFVLPPAPTCPFRWKHVP